MNKTILISIIAMTASVSGMAADDSPRPHYQAPPRAVRDIPGDKISISFPLTHPMYDPFPAAKLIESKHSVSPLLIINPFSERFEGEGKRLGLKFP